MSSAKPSERRRIQSDLGRAAADIKQDGAPVFGGRRGAQDSMASSASSRAEMIRNESPVSAFTRARKAGPFSARRQASVATASSRRMGRRASLAAQTDSAASARSIAASDSRPVACSPSPRRTMRLKLSITRKPAPQGVPMSSRQLLVPRSSAA